jgi:hypothetical protein
MSSDLLTLDLDDLEDELLQADRDFDMMVSFNLDPSLGEIESAPPPTLESILNEDDDEETDEILQSFKSTLTSLNDKQRAASLNSVVSSTLNSTLDTHESSSSQTPKSRSNTISSLTERNGIVCKQALLKQISNQVIVAIERSESGLPTVLAVGMNTIAVGTSRGLVLLFDSLQVLKLYITTEYKDAITAISLNNKCDRLLVGNALGYIFMFDHNGKSLKAKY